MINREKIIDFLVKYRGFFIILIGSFLSFFGFRLFLLVPYFFREHYDILLGVIAILFANWFFKVAFSLYDDYSYNCYVKKTADDFEQRYGKTKS